MVLRFNHPTRSYRKQLIRNKFICKLLLQLHLILAILPIKLTQIYHNYLKRPYFEQLFFMFFY